MTTDILDDFDDSFDAAADPSAPSDAGDDFFIPIPPTICGVLRMHIADIKPSPKDKSTVLMELKCEDPMFRDATFTNWFNFGRNQLNVKQFVEICKVLGVKAEQRGRQFAISGGLKSLKGLAGLFVVTTFKRKDGTVSSTLAFGMPKKEKSEEWTEYVGTRTLTDEQVKVIKESPGVIPEEHHSLFEGINSDADI